MNKKKSSCKCGSFCYDEDYRCCQCWSSIAACCECDPDYLSLKDPEKRTPLHAAAFLGDAEITELLILSGKTFSGFLFLLRFFLCDIYYLEECFLI